MSSTTSSSTGWSDTSPHDAGRSGGSDRPAVVQQPHEVPRPWELLDDGLAPEPCDLLVIGCGNILRGDDAFGPVLIRTLHQRGFPAGVRLVDGGTSGMDVAFGMRGAAKVVLVDACATGRPPGTLYRMPASELGEVPPLAGLHSHNFRWDHALSLSAWLLGPLAPTDVEVILCEAGSLQPGQPLSAEVQAQVDVVADLLERELYPAPPVPAHVTLTDAGSLHLTASQAERWFPSGLLVARVDEAGEEPVLELVPLAGAGHGGLVLKQRNLAGDRSVLLSEVLGFGAGATVAVPGDLGAHWDDDRGVLRVDLRTRHAGPDPGDGGSDRARGVDRGGG